MKKTSVYLDPATVRIATFDERHFRALRPLDRGERFVLLPADET